MKQTKTTLLTTTGLFAALITLCTAYICHIPSGINGGYVHFGDTFIFLAAVLLPRPYAIIAAVIGGGMADLLTAPAWVPFTILAKALIVLPFTSTNGRLLSMRNKIAPIIALPISVIVYFFAEGILYGSFAASAFSIPGNIIQGVGSGIFFYLLATALEKSNVKNRFLKDNSLKI